MFELTPKQILQVSGSNRSDFVFMFGMLSVINFIWNLVQDEEIDNLWVYTVYQEAQLKLLPHYDEVDNQPYGQVLNSLY